MRSIFSIAVAAVAALSTVNAQTPTDPTDGQPTTGTAADLSLAAYSLVGCYSDPGEMFDMGYYTFQAMGWCQPLCVRLAKPYLAFVNGTNCFCGDKPPSDDSKVDPSMCQTKCKGFPDQACGGVNNWAVWNDGYQFGDPTGTVKIHIPGATPTPVAQSDSSGSGSSPVTYVSTAVHTVGGTVEPTTVIVVTQTQAPVSDPAPGPNKVAIAIGVVIGVVALAAIIGGLFFFMRHRKRQAVEEERRRHEMMTSIVSGEKPGTSYSTPDSRLEPSFMFQRRQSDGSIADNQDYSRRILTVTNPDDR